MSLTEDQRKAAHAPGGVAVTAGAGTGKTMMLAERYLFHVRDQKFSPLEVVAVTFTDKAADELRSRIRKEIGRSIENESVLAEVEAAQISTIHALAARICRDFYDLAGIPPDFSVLDETESPMFLAGAFDEAMAKAVRPGIIAELGYSWVASALLRLLDDPLAAERAFSHGPEQWSAAVEKEKQRSLDELVNGEVWCEARHVFSSFRGADSDLLEASRRGAVSAMSAVESGTNPSAAAAHFKSLKTNVGKKDSWPAGGVDDVKAAIKGLKVATADCFAFGPESSIEDDNTLHERVALLREAFAEVKSFLSEAKLKEKVLDYNDLETYALRVLKQSAATEHYAKRWRAFLVDEFQDTNPVQAEIIELLAADAKLTIVGDEKQAIYGFRGADASVFRRLYENITRTGGDEVELSLSFRTHQPLVTKVNRVFRPMLGVLHQELSAARVDACNDEPCVSLHVVGAGDGPVPKFRQQIVEARHIAAEIERMVSAGVLVHDKRTDTPRGAEYRDFAILSRTWAPLDTYLDSLAALGIPAVHAGGGSLLETREAKDAYALLSFLADPFDDISLVTVLRSPFFAVSDIALLKFAQTMPAKTPWWAALEDGGEELFRPREVLSEILRQASKNSPARLLQIADRLTGYGSVIANLVHGPRREADWRGVLDLLRKLERRGRGDVFSVARHFRELIASETEIERPPLNSGQAVSLMTIHKSKGLEWPVVFVPDLARVRNHGVEKFAVDPDIGVAFPLEGPGEESTEPSIYRLIKNRKKDRENEEAKRVLYVALTRARDRVVLTSTKDKGPDIDLLGVGLAAAEISNLEIVYTEEKAVPPAPLPPRPLNIPALSQIEAVRLGPTDVSVTSLGSYAECPRSFWYINVEGHPGLGEGSPRARIAGSLTHKALEFDMQSADELRSYEPAADYEFLLEAISLANRFRADPCYESVRGSSGSKEVAVGRTVMGVNLHGIADLVGEDFVLDYKTDSTVDPAHHRFQLWAYATSLGKSKAYIAYLRHGQLYEFDGPALDEAGVDALRIIQGIGDGEFAPTPGPAVCGYCRYAEICDYRSVPAVEGLCPASE